uniref:Apple domain-containing protein n=1 Tax=Steinernema glaseri TaxID=37863 RepID=A0A1I7Y5A7_9BILA
MEHKGNHSSTDLSFEETLVAKCHKKRCLLSEPSSSASSASTIEFSVGFSVIQSIGHCVYRPERCAYTLKRLPLQVAAEKKDFFFKHDASIELEVAMQDEKKENIETVKGCMEECARMDDCKGGVHTTDDRCCYLVKVIFETRRHTYRDKGQHSFIMLNDDEKDKCDTTFMDLIEGKLCLGRYDIYMEVLARRPPRE